MHAVAWVRNIRVFNQVTLNRRPCLDTEWNIYMFYPALWPHLPWCISYSGLKTHSSTYSYVLRTWSYTAPFRSTEQNPPTSAQLYTNSSMQDCQSTSGSVLPPLMGICTLRRIVLHRFLLTSSGMVCFCSSCKQRSPLFVSCARLFVSFSPVLPGLSCSSMVPRHTLVNGLAVPADGTPWLEFTIIGVWCRADLMCLSGL